MQKFPHRYAAQAEGGAEGQVQLSSAGLPVIASAPPTEFDGPGDQWSPETLLVAAVVDCFTLSFRAVARTSRVEWDLLRCEGEGELDRVERVTRFTAIQLRAHLTVPPQQDVEAARRALAKAEQVCLISRSLVCPVSLEPVVAVAGKSGAG